MPTDAFELAIVSDEVSRSLDEALEVGAAWGLTRFELREGAQGRFPFFTATELQRLDAEVRLGVQITAVSPGVFKGAVADEQRLRRELQEVLPRSLDGAARLACPLVIVFGFARYAGDSPADRVRVLRALEDAAEQATAAGLRLAVENEPAFWVDRPEETVSLLEELGHPTLQINWDPANLHWGGCMPTYEGFQRLQPYLANLHVKDYTPDDETVPWRPLGQGQTPWEDLLRWVTQETDLSHATLETHCEPLLDNARASLEYARSLLEAL